MHRATNSFFTDAFCCAGGKALQPWDSASQAYPHVLRAAGRSASDHKFQLFTLSFSFLFLT